MNWDQIAGEWRQAKGRLRAKWAKLTEPPFAAAPEVMLPPPPSDPIDEASWESFPASDPPALSRKNT